MPTAIAGRMRCWSRPYPAVGRSVVRVRTNQSTTTSCSSIAQKKDGSETPIVPSPQLSDRTRRDEDKAYAAPAATPRRAAPARAAMTSTRLRPRASGIAWASGFPRNGSAPRRSTFRVSVWRSASRRTLCVNHATKTAVTAAAVIPCSSGRRSAARAVTPPVRAAGRCGSPSQDGGGERPAPGPEAIEGEIGDVDRRRPAVEHLLDDELRRRRRVHEPVARESGRDVEALDVGDPADDGVVRSEEHTSELQSLAYLVCRLLLEKK